MKVGDKVVRNPKFGRHCLCMIEFDAEERCSRTNICTACGHRRFQYTCNGIFTVTKAWRTKFCSSGVKVNVRIGRVVFKEFDSSWFLKLKKRKA